MPRSIRRTAPTFALALLLNMPFFVSSGLAQELMSQVLEEEAVDAESLAVETSAELLRLRPRFRGNFDSESGGIDSFASADAFLPLLQDPGSSTFYFNPKLRFDFDGDSTVGGNLIFGYRNYNQERDRILGGYLSFDVRDTGDSVFPQIGLGFERLGRFDIRANGYIPVGDTSQVVDRFETGFSITDSGFQGRSLQLTAENTIWEDSEVALGGFDVEAGGSIVRWHSHGNLELFGGVYYLGGDNVSAVGGRGRVALTPTDGIQLEVGVQGDDVFGTRVFFNATAHLPHPKAIAPTSEEDEALAEAGNTFARLDDPVARIDSVVVDEQRDSETLVVTGPALNPDTGEPWVFTHVVAGGNSDGSFEDPFATVQEGLDATTGGGNDIVYVRLGNDTIPAFTIPDNVRVISSGPEQRIDLQIAGIDADIFEDELLPESASGELPLVVGTVTMGNSTLLSGFDIQPQLDVEIDPQPAPGDPGVLARSVSDFTITDNEISTIDANGIELDGDIANGEITNNIIAVTTTSPEEVDGEEVDGDALAGDELADDDDSSVAGIFMSQTEANLSGVTILENDIMVSGARGSGIIAQVTGDKSPASIRDLAIANNSLSVTTEESAEIVRRGNPFFSITSQTSAGIEIDIENGELSDVTVANNEIAFSGLSGSGITSQLLADGTSAGIDGLDITNNTIDVALVQAAEGDYGGSGSGISTDAIAYNGGTASLSNLTITGNTIAGEAGSQFTGVETNAFAGRFGAFSGEPEEATESAGVTNTIAANDITIANNTISSVSGDRSTGVVTNIYAANNRYYFEELGPSSEEQSTVIQLDRTTISGNTISTEAGDRAVGISTNIIALNFSRYSVPIREEALDATSDTAPSGTSVGLTSTDISGNSITSDAEGDAVGIEANVVAVNFIDRGLIRRIPEREPIGETSDRSQSTVTLVDTTISGNTIASQAIDEATGIGISTNALNYSNDGRFAAVAEVGNLSTSSSPANVTLQNTTIDGNAIENDATHAYGIVLDNAATDRNPFLAGPPINERPEVEARAIEIAEVDAAEISTDANASVRLSNTTIANNTITNVGDYGVGIEITGDDTPFFYDDEEFDGPRRFFGSGDSQVAIDRTTISGNTIAHTTDPSSTAGILVSLGGRVGGRFTLQDTEISGNTITGNGPEADGIIVEAFGQYFSELEVANTLISGNTVTLEGSVIDAERPRIESSGIVVSFTTGYYSELTASNTTISDNSVITINDDSVGIELFVEAEGYYSKIALSETTITGNEVETSGERADGIAIEANAIGDFFRSYAEVSLDSTTVSGNTVVTRGDYAAGVIASTYAYYGDSQLDVTISDNKIDTFGNNSPGILAESSGYGRDLNDVTITANTVTTRGEDSAGIELNSDDDGDVDAAISDNIASVQDGSIAFLLEGVYGSVCADLSGNTSFSNGKSFDLGIFEEDGDEVAIVGFTDFPTLSADNNNSFGAITGSTPDPAITCSVPRKPPARPRR